MISLDKEALKAYVWHYSQREGIIQPETWEKIICQSVEGGEWQIIFSQVSGWMIPSR